MENQVILVKLAKEKGYNRFHPQWFENNKLDLDSWLCELVLLQKWLREIKYYHIILIPQFNNKWIYYIIYISLISTPFNSIINNQKKSNKFNSYKEALENGLQETLKLI